jgi:hypothetical protein
MIITIYVGIVACQMWLLAVIISLNPATPAPSECEFGMAGNVLDKKRAHLSAENAKLLLILHRGNKDIVKWD